MTVAKGKYDENENLPEVRREVVTWAKHMIERPFVVVDTEATDKKPEQAEPVQVAIVGSDEKTIYKSYIKPQRPMKAEAAEITGITPEMLKDAPSFKDVNPHILAALADKQVVAYNAGFDRVLLRHTAVRLDLPDPCGPVEWEDAMIEFSGFYGDYNVHHYYGGSCRWKGLAVAMLTFGLVNETAHDAEADALATVRLIKALAAVDLDKPGVYQFDAGRYTILYPDSKTYVIDRKGGEGVLAEIKGEITKSWSNRPEAIPAEAVPTISLAPEEIEAKRQKLNVLLAEYAPARVAYDEEGKRLAEQESAIKALYMELDAGGVQGAHDALLAKETRKWEYSEAILLELAQKHDASLLKYKLDESQFEAKLQAGLMGWAGAFAPVQKVNRFAAWNPNALKLVAAIHKPVQVEVKTEPSVPLPARPDVLLVGEDEQEKIPF